MEGRTAYEYGVSSTFVKEYLRDKKIPFEETETPVFAYVKKDVQIVIWKQAVQIDAHDIKNVLSELNLYEDFIEKYAIKLKSLQPSFQPNSAIASFSV